MKITVLDGTLDSTPKTWNKYLHGLTTELENKGHVVNHITLKDNKINFCVGCFKCWVRTPGVCVFDDDSREINRAVIQSDFVLFASPLVMGFATSVLKKKMDRMLPLIHPYFEIVQGETHHLPRYDHYPLFGLLLQPESADTEENISITSQIFARTALNIKSRLVFAVTTEESARNLAARFENLESENYKFKRSFHQIETARIGKVRKLIVFNGSPRGKRGNSPIILDHIMRGFTSIGGNTAEISHLNKINQQEAFFKKFKEADCVLIGFPLYTDGMPGIVKEFIETLQPFTKLEGNPPIAFMVQSGFSEALHSRYVEQYLKTLADRLNSPYLGTLVRGGGESIRLLPESMNKKLFATLKELGRQLGAYSRFDKKTVKAFSSHERYSPFLIPLMKLLAKMPINQRYWNVQLEKNNVFEDRFARPYEEIAAGV